MQSDPIEQLAAELSMRHFDDTDERALPHDITFVAKLIKVAIEKTRGHCNTCSCWEAEREVCEADICQRIREGMEKP